MRAFHISDLLVSFDEKLNSDFDEIDPSVSIPVHCVSDDFRSITVVEHLALLEQARAEVRIELADKNEQICLEASDQLKKAREDWVEFEAKQFHLQLERGLHEIELALTTVTLQLVKPFIVERFQEKAVEGFAQAVSRLLRSKDMAGIEIRGETDLLARLAVHMAPLGLPLLFTPSDQTEIELKISTTVIETELGRWASALDKMAEVELP